MNATPPESPANPAGSGRPDPATRTKVAGILERLRQCREALDLLQLHLPAAHVDMAVQSLKRDFGLRNSLRENRPGAGRRLRFGHRLPADESAPGPFAND